MQSLYDMCNGKVERATRGRVEYDVFSRLNKLTTLQRLILHLIYVLSLRPRCSFLRTAFTTVEGNPSIFLFILQFPFIIGRVYFFSFFARPPTIPPYMYTVFALGNVVRASFRSTSKCSRPCRINPKFILHSYNPFIFQFTFLSTAGRIAYRLIYRPNIISR